MRDPSQVRISAGLEAGGLEPVLVGGMALVVLGSRRVTRDFDFLISAPARPNNLVEVMYRHGLQLVTKLDSNGGVRRTDGNLNQIVLHQ